MSRRAFSDAAALLNDLLDRHELKPEASRIIAHVDEEGFASVDARDRFLAALALAERAGAIRVRQGRRHGETVLGYVALDDASALYAHLARTPAGHRVAFALKSVRARTDLPPGADALLDGMAAAWTRGVRHFGLAAGDVAGLSDSLTLATALAKRAGDSEASPVDFRTFSRSSGVDSKALERLARPAVAFLDRLYALAGQDEGLDAEDRLATLGVLRTPQPLLVSGTLLHGDLALPPLLYHGIPPEQGGGIALAGTPQYVLTIENYVSFVRHVREINPDRSALILYTGGFPARAHLRQIVRLAASSGAEIFHWGDLDLGGVRIFHHLELALNEQGIALRPHLMDTERLCAGGVPSSAKVPAPSGSAAASTIAGIWEALAETGLMLEQESLAPVHPLQGRQSGA